MKRLSKPGKPVVCPDCDTPIVVPSRRDFLRTAGAAAAAASGIVPVFAEPKAQAASTPQSKSETAAAALYESLTDEQKKVVAFEWDHKDPQRGLLRTHVSNNWHITKPTIDGSFYTDKQRRLIRDVYEGLFNPEWIAKIDKQLKDDTDGKPWGADQNIAFFGKPGGKFEFVMTGRHLTCRADGNSEAHVALGGPIFHGHAASGFNEKVHHPGNIFWHQAVEANKVFAMLDGKQQKAALVSGRRPQESNVRFRGADGKYPGLPVAEMTKDQVEQLKKVLTALIEPYRTEDREEIAECLNKRGGLDKCSLAFYEDGDIGDDREWDNWRLEGPAFVWYFRGHPHVHIWINVADDPSVPLNARG